MAYIGKSPTGAGVRSRFHFTATGGETSLSGADDNGKTLVFADGEYVDVYLNGVLLFDGDYNTTTANTIGGLDALTASDVVEIVVYDIFSVADTVSAKNGGTFSGDVTVNGDLTVDTDTLHVDSTNDRVGVGTTSPSRTLSVDKGTGAGYIAEFKGTNTLSIYDGDTTGIGIGSGAGDNLRLYAGDSFNNSITVTTSGDVGIGNTNPRTPLEIRRTNTLGSTFTGTTNGEGLRVTQTNYTSGNYVSLVESSYDDANSSPNVRIAAKFNASGSHLAFGTSNAYASGVTNEAMTIAPTGGIRIGQTSTDSPGAANTTTGVGIQQNGRIHASADGTWSSFNRNNENGTLLNFYRSGVGVGDISVTTSSTSYNTSSDHRLKENVETMSGAITRVKSLKPKRFSWIVDDEDAATVDGFLAHEAQSVVPEAVTGTHDEVDDDGNPVYQAIDQSKLVPLLTGALQEAITKIETLETEMTALKARVTALENA